MLMDETFSSDASDYYSSQDVLNDQDMDIEDIKEEYNNGGRVGYGKGSLPQDLVNIYKYLKKIYPKLKFGAKKEIEKILTSLEKKTITVKRGESGTAGASGANSNPNYKGSYYTPEGGGFGNIADDARYYSRLGGPEGNPKVLTAELTPEEVKEGIRLRSLDVDDPEIGDIILPESAKDKVSTDYINTIRAKIEKVLGYNNGGRVGYSKGPKDPRRRTIIKGLTALAAVPFIGRYFKLAKPVDKAISGVQTVIEKVKGLPDWFQPFVNKVLKVGKDVTDEAATIEREIVKRVDIEDATVDVHYNTATNDVRVEIVGGKNALDEPLQMDYKAPEVIEETGKKTQGSFSAVESKPQPIQIGADDFDIETGENVTDVLDDLLSETDYLEGFATGKIRTPKEIARAKKRTMHRENMKKNPTDYVVDPSEGNPYAMGDYEKFYETVTDLDGIDDLLDLKYLKKKWLKVKRVDHHLNQDQTHKAWIFSIILLRQ